MIPGLPPYEWWKNPPDKVLLRVYVFNITNAVEFQNGTDSKIKLQEVGPYVFLEGEDRRNRKAVEHNNPRRGMVREQYRSAPALRVSRIRNSLLSSAGWTRVRTSQWSGLGVSLSLFGVSSESGGRPSRSSRWLPHWTPTRYTALTHDTQTPDSQTFSLVTVAPSLDSHTIHCADPRYTNTGLTDLLARHGGSLTGLAHDTLR
uniref:Uncharacterized protein n=1 Tax=Timema douglasi TaxID=61478 RepID=A0A7R8ZFV9_TIMDO|nr:unnamed protein product [Timema douglasi]